MRYTLALLLVFWGSQLFSQSLKVGIYQNPPLIGLDSADGPGGFMVKLLDEIAKENNWQLEYQQYDFAACLKALQSGEIDIMPALAYSQHRDTLFYLNEVNVAVNWASLYKHEDDNSQYNSVEALRNQRVGVLADDYYGQNGENGLLDLLDELDIITNIKYFNSYQEVVSAIEAEEIDLGLLSRYYGELQTVEKDVVKAPVNVAYVSLRYGFHRSEENSIRLAELDRTLESMIGQKNSIYYQLEKTHLAAKGSAFIPGWLWQTFAVVMLGLATLAIFNLLLQYQVKRKTGELKESNRLLAKSEQEARLAANTIEASQDIGFWFLPNERFVNVNSAACRLTGYDREELLSMVPAQLFASDRNKEIYDRVRAGDWDGHLLIEDQLQRKNGIIFPVELSLDEFIMDGKTYICGFARDISERVNAENALIEKNKELTCLYAINQLSSDRSLPVKEIFERAISIIPIAWQFPELTVVRIKVNGNVYSSKIFKESPWQLKSDIYEGDRQVGEIIVAYLSQPKGGDDPFLNEENNLISALASEFSNMLTTRGTQRRIMSTILSTQDEERSRIAKELHDSVGQTLSAISLHLHAMTKIASITDEERNKLFEVEELVKNAIGESRSVSHDLMPPALTDLGFAYAVENIIESLADVSDTSFNFHTNSNSIKVDKKIEFGLFRIVQEAINNIIKYAGAKETTIQYLVYENEISLSIEDDGQGYDMNLAEKNHNFGLNSMRTRTMSLGGEIDINSSPGRGTSIQIQIPLN